MVDGDQAGPLRPRLQDRLVPELGLRARVGEHERRACLRDLAQHGFEHPDAEVAAPGKAAGVVGQQGVDDERLVDATPHQYAVGAVQQRAHGLVEVAERCAQAPGRQARRKAAQPRQRELHLHSALVADQLVPFVDHDQGQAGEQFATVGTGEQQRQAFRCRDQHFGQAPALPGALRGAGVAGACADLPRQAEVGQRCGQRPRRVRRQRPHRRDPQQAQAAGGDLAGQRPAEQAEVDRIGLAGPRGRVQQPGAAGGDLGPDLALEVERRDAVRREPALRARQRELGREKRKRRRAGTRRWRPGPGGLRVSPGFLPRRPGTTRPELGADIGSGRKAAHEGQPMRAAMVAAAPRPPDPRPAPMPTTAAGAENADAARGGVCDGPRTSTT